MAFDGLVEPIIILNKSDLVSGDQLEYFLGEVKKIAKGCEVVTSSTQIGGGVSEVRNLIKENETIALVGSSGVGKSSLINKIFGEDIQKTHQISKVLDKGGHTTTMRSIISMPNGVDLIDTPGIRELQLWEGDRGSDELFSDILLLMTKCRFSNCDHHHSAGCAVQIAIDNGELESDRFYSFLKTRKEQAFLEKKNAAKSSKRKKEIWKKRDRSIHRRNY